MGASASVSEQLRIQVEGRWYVLATSARVEGQVQTLKRDDMFALFDRYGDILPWEGGEQGPVHAGHALPVASGAAAQRRAARCT